VVLLKKPLDKIVRSVQAFGREFKRQQKPPSTAVDAPRSPRIGVALGGGFARGLAHIGVLKVLEEEGVPIDFIAGTSVGAVIGAAYASGICAKELEEIAALVRFKDFSRWTLSRFGLFSNDKMALFLNKFLRCKTFEELRIPLAVTATDIVTGEPVVFTSGDLVDPVRASCAYPGMFLPVNINGRLLVDGLLGHGVPAAPLRDLGAERVVAIFLSAHWVRPKGPRHVFDLIGQCFSIAQAKMCGPWKAASDIILEPAIGEFSYDDFGRAPELIRAGEAVARAALPQIRQWLPQLRPVQSTVIEGATVPNPAAPALAK
jgi:NTE family protein